MGTFLFFESAMQGILKDKREKNRNVPIFRRDPHIQEK